MKKIAAITVLLIGMCLARVAGASEGSPPYPFMDYKLPIETRVADLVSRLTPEEKASLLNNTAHAVPRLGIKEYQYWNEALHGIAWSIGGAGGRFTIFPQAMGIAATWDPDLVFKITTAISDEAWGAINRDTAKNGYPAVRFLDFWSPTINMARDPRWGRTPETYGEDPWLTSRLAVAFVKGMQGDNPKYIKAVSTPKHFAANNEEHNRFRCDARITQPTLREYYFPAFKACVMEGGALSVMGAYNAVNGLPCNANPWLLNEVLRGEWGFKGYVTTDCGALHMLIEQHRFVKTREESAAAAIKSGVDIECGGEEVMRKDILGALNRGLIQMSDLDLAITHLMTIRMRLGMFDPPELNDYTKISPDMVGSKEHMELARQTSRESIVLLKNDRVGRDPLLPLDPARIGSVVVVGPNANKMLYGDYSGTPANSPVTPLDGIRNRLRGLVNITYLEWIAEPADNQYKPVPKERLRSGNDMGLKAEYFANREFKGAPVLTQIDDGVNLNAGNAPPRFADSDAISVKWTGKIVPDRSGQYYFYLGTSGEARLIVGGKLVLEARGEKKKKKLSSGRVFDTAALDPRAEKRKTAMLMLESGKAVDVRIEYAAAKGVGAARFDWAIPTDDDAARAKKIQTIRESDAVIAFMGLQVDDERENMDRPSLDLPNDQTEYVEQLRALNQRIVLALVTGSSLSFSRLKRDVPAILHTWYSGEQGGNAIADVLFGDYNPAGRLPMTFYKSLDDLPPFDDYEISHGRTYMYYKGETLFPFGHGLSYTTFRYDKLMVDKKKAGPADTVAVKFNVRNTGGRDGDEVAQLYVHALDAGAGRPMKQLRGFRRVRINKGETKTIEIPLAVKDLSFWNQEAGAFKVIPGRYEILVGSSAADIHLKGEIVVSGD